MSADGRGPRLLIYSQDGLGLGHLRRTTLLASRFLAERPDGSVMTICDSPTGQFFASAPGHDHLKLPSIRKDRPGEWSPVSLSLPFEDVLQLRKEVIRAAACGFRPDVLLVDHMPHGAMGELVPTLEALEPLPVRMVLGLRDILDAPETVGRRWRLEGAFEAVERYFDDVLVYGSRRIFDVAEQYRWPAVLRQRLRYCGYVCAPGTESSPESTRRHYLASHSAEKLVVAMAGGGADGFPMLETLIRAAPAVVAAHSCALVVVTGPFLPEPQQAQLRRLAADLPIEVLTTVSDSLRYMGAADLVVTMAGYNTTAELLRLGARALLVPRPGPSAEQQMRASRLAERGWVDWLSPGSLSVEALGDAVISALDAPAAAVADRPDLRGLEHAVQHLLSEPSGSERSPGLERLVAPGGRAAPGSGPALMLDEC
jgi:predicted glycosyltransferase